MYTQTDENGWTYASSFSRFATHIFEGRSLTDKKDPKALVRRRKWFRKAVLAKELDVSVTPETIECELRRQLSDDTASQSDMS